MQLLSSEREMFIQRPGNRSVLGLSIYAPSFAIGCSNREISAEPISVMQFFA
jgi:hypothetical protein